MLFVMHQIRLFLLTLPISLAGTISLAGLLVSGQAGAAKTLAYIDLPGDRVFPESLSAGPDRTLYVSSPATGGILRVKPGASEGEVWIKPGAFDSRSTFGVLVDPRAQLLWVCSNDISSFGVPGPNAIKGSYLKGFDLATGEGKVSAALPGSHQFCNDIAVAEDGAVYVTDSLAPHILVLRPGSKELEVLIEDSNFTPPKGGVGLDGIAVGVDGHLYVNTFSKGELFRVALDGVWPGKVTKLATSRPLKLTDGLRPLADGSFLMIEGSGSLDHVLIYGDEAVIETIQAGLDAPTAVTKFGATAYVTEGQLPHLFNAAASGPPRLPFRIVTVPIEP